ncbi:MULTISPECIES: DUF72 domain-containing protein [unclassified Rhizobium]|uniref:DUF72 domain-containing protein n=1 Tax=unclassified Rhizobium TaxID=2613769 RepID=UPI0006FD7C14|nr:MULTISPECIES: DUF72 domain-containing protein [unclassified Rhizobium]KQV38049.1 hypothetical protein ASC86_07345 [Rhizobium sp. Root1212]KRD30706.1 hypothetical protein ASE37_07340 [Rhizobium sp. Root268]
MPFIATAGWSIPKTVAHLFPEKGSGLSRYATVFNGAEINSTFYRHYQRKTFERWASVVPDDFRFAVKLPREITHEQRLRSIGPLFNAFLGDVSGLGDRLGPLLCQLPPSLRFDAAEVTAAFAAMRDAFPGMIVIEPRHTGWASPSAEEVLRRFAIDRVLADPAPVWGAGDFTEPPKYVRLHGTPRMYYSNYDEAEIRTFGKRLAAGSWCVFDNTASGAAIENALTMRDQLA